MSDKHKDAKGELQAVLNQVYPLPDGAVDPGHDEKILERREGFRQGWKEARRASQVSAAEPDIASVSEFHDLMTTYRTADEPVADSNGGVA